MRARDAWESGAGIAAPAVGGDDQPTRRLAVSTLADRPDAPDIPWADLKADYDLIRDGGSHVVPGFEEFNERVKAPDGFTLPKPIKSGVLQHPER